MWCLSFLSLLNPDNHFPVLLCLCLVCLCLAWTTLTFLLPVFSLRLNISTSSDGDSALVTPGPEPPPQPLDLLVPEAVLAFFLLLLLVWFLNREFEVSYRLHYHGNVEADKHRSKIQTMRDQAEWLLGNIIPIHVADQLKVFVDVETKISDLIMKIIRTVLNTFKFFLICNQEHIFFKEI